MSDDPVAGTPPRHAVLLAAGYGHRMRPLTVDRPKCMLAVAGTLMIDRALAALRSRGCERVTVVTGYQEQVLISHLSGWRGSLDIRTVPNGRYGASDSMLTLALALDVVDEPTWVLESDVVFEPAVLDLPAPYPISWFADSAATGLGGVHLTRDATGTLRRVKVFADPPDPRAGLLKSTGLMRLDRHGVLTARRWLARAVAQDRVRERYDAVLADHPGDRALGVVDVNGLRWFEADTPGELAIADRLFACPAWSTGAGQPVEKDTLALEQLDVRLGDAEPGHPIQLREFPNAP